MGAQPASKERWEPGLGVRGQPVRGWCVHAKLLVDYEVRFCPQLLEPGNGALAEAGVEPAGSRRRLVVVDSRVERQYGHQISGYLSARGIVCQLCVLQAHEQAKTMESVFKIIEAMDTFGIARREEPVIAIGGGVLLDIVGLAAALYRRSTPYVRVPTTLIGMVDAGVGIKTGVNYGMHKNRLGAYHPAVETLVDPAFLATLDARHLRNGMAEILKIALAKDAALFDMLTIHGERLVAGHFQEVGAGVGMPAEEVLRRSIHDMLEELQPNLWEKDLQRLADYGHSFSPAIEMQALPELLHGEAVNIDMAFTTMLAARRGLLPNAAQARILAVMRQLNLPVTHPVCTVELMSRAMEETARHRGGRQRLPLPVGIGVLRFVDDVTTDEIAATVEAIAGQAHDGPALPVEER